MCVGFLSEAAELCLLSLLLLGVGWAVVKPLLVWLLCLFLGRLRFSTVCPAAGYPWRVPQPIWLPLTGVLLQWTFVVGLALSWYTTWFSTLCQRSFLCCSLPLAGSATFLAPVCWPTPAVEPCCWVGGVAWFSTLCRALPLGPAVCAAYPAAGSLGDFLPFLSPGARPSAALVA